jgi:CRISPR-associated protein Csm5
MKIETLSPVHVGDGDKYTAMDFVIEDGKVIFLDILTVFQELDRRGEDVMEVAEDIGSGRLRMEDIVDDVHEFKQREVRFVGGERGRGKEIMKHIQSTGRLYIPGSSIKGAIRTALLWKAVKDDERLIDWVIQYTKREEKINTKKVDDKLEAKVFRSSKRLNKDDPKNDMLRALRITDTTPFTQSTVYEIKFVNMRGFTDLAECIDAGDSADVEIDIDEYTLSVLDQRLDFDDVKEAAREFAEEIVKTEMERGYPERTKNEFKNVLRSKGLPLRIGWGIGWFSTTIGTLLITKPEFESIRRKLKLGRRPRGRGFSRNFPVTRRITWDNKPLGWIAIHG